MQVDDIVDMIQDELAQCKIPPAQDPLFSSYRVTAALNGLESLGRQYRSLQSKHLGFASHILHFIKHAGRRSDDLHLQQLCNVVKSFYPNLLVRLTTCPVPPQFHCQDESIMYCKHQCLSCFCTQNNAQRSLRAMLLCLAQGQMKAVYYTTRMTSIWEKRRKEWTASAWCRISFRKRYCPFWVAAKCTLMHQIIGPESRLAQSYCSSGCWLHTCSTNHLACKYGSSLYEPVLWQAQDSRKVLWHCKILQRPR